LATNDLGGFLSNLNAARASALTYTADGSPNGQPLDSPPPLTTNDVPNTAAGRLNLLFQERALDLFLTGHRLGDMRRLVWQYGRDPNIVFPIGPYEPTNSSKAGTNYGTDVNFPIPQEESNNPLFLKANSSCIDRSAGIGS
jgi:starch-binding outer membrane protein, SusD/RagB family